MYKTKPMWLKHLLLHAKIAMHQPPPISCFVLGFLPPCRRHSYGCATCFGRAQREGRGRPMRVSEATCSFRICLGVLDPDSLTGACIQAMRYKGGPALGKQRHKQLLKILPALQAGRRVGVEACIWGACRFPNRWAVWPNVMYHKAALRTSYEIRTTGYSQMSQASWWKRMRKR